MSHKKKTKRKKSKKSKPFKLKRITTYKSIYDQILGIAPMVADILLQDLEARDDDNILLIRVWQRQGFKDKMSFKGFKYKLIMGRLALPESIMRARRRLQAKYKSLRGSLYIQRHQAEEDMKKQMKLDF